MSDMFQMTSPDLIRLESLFRKAPKKMQAVVAGVLNSQAFGLRTRILKTLHKEMTIRAPGFVKGRVRVVKTRSGPINAMESEAGSIFGDRFDGWKTQQFGTASERKRVHTRFSRGGNWRGKVRQKLRSKQSNPLWQMSDFNIDNAKNEKHRMIIFLQMLDKRNIKDRFAFPGQLGKMNKNIFKMVRGKVKGVSHRSNEVAKTRRIRWMDKSIDLLNKEVNPQKLWEKNVKFIFKLR